MGERPEPGTRTRVNPAYLNVGQHADLIRAVDWFNRCGNRCCLFCGKYERCSKHDKCTDATRSCVTSIGATHSCFVMERP